MEVRIIKESNEKVWYNIGEIYTVIDQFKSENKRYQVISENFDLNGRCIYQEDCEIIVKNEKNKIRQDFVFTLNGILEIDTKGNVMFFCTPEEARKIIEERDGWIVHKPLVELAIRHVELLRGLLEVTIENYTSMKNIFNAVKEIKGKLNGFKG